MRKGFTLIELLIAAAVLILAVCGVLAVFSNCIFLNMASSNQTVALSHAQYYMEAIKNIGFTNLQTNIDNGVWNKNSAAINSAGLTALSNENIATDTPSPPGANPLDVILTVSWKDPFNRNRSFSLETLISDH